MRWSKQKQHGCGNAVIRSMNLSIDDITLRFYEPTHGQNEGDSAHSTIEYAIRKAGDIFLPSQLGPITRLSRKDKTYIVHQLNLEDFLEFTTLS